MENLKKFYDQSKLMTTIIHYDHTKKHQKDFNYTHLSSTHSTNSQLIDWIILSYQEQSCAEHKRPHFSRPHLLTAGTQSSGRGQHGRTWQSPVGNVYLSLYVPMQAVSSQQDICLANRLDGRLSLCVGYQLSKLPIITRINETRMAQQLPTIGVKWVNDVGFYEYKDDQRYQFQKLAGILIEPVSLAGQLLGVVVGVGVNIAQAPVLTHHTQEGLNYQAISLQALTAQILCADAFYQPVTDAIAQAIAQFNQFQSPQASQQFIGDFAHMDVLKNHYVNINNALSQTAISGIASGIDEQGCLLIRQADGDTQPIWTGTIQVLDR